MSPRLTLVLIPLSEVPFDGSEEQQEGEVP